MYKKKLLYLSLAACMMGSVPITNLHAQERTMMTQNQEQENQEDQEENKKNEDATTEKKQEAETTTASTTATTESTTHKKKVTHKKKAAKKKKKIKDSQDNKKKTKDSKKNNKKKEKQEKESSKKNESKNTNKTNKEEEEVSLKTYEELSLKIKNNKEYVGSYIYFNQADEAWNHSGLSIHSAGCGPTAVAVCLVNLTSNWITPVDVASWGAQNGYYSSAGSVHEGIPAMVEHFGLQCEGVGTDYNKIKTALKNGDMVIGLMGPGYFTKGGHFITLVEIDENDQVTVADVGSRTRSQYKYALKDVIGESKAAGAGGPFWVVKGDHKKNHENKSQNTREVKKITRNESMNFQENTDAEKKVEQRNKLIEKFYQSAKNDFNEFENGLPEEIVYTGNERSVINNDEKRNSKINKHLEQLATELNDPYLMQIAQNYDFGSDKISKSEISTFNLKAYLANSTKEIN